MSIKVLCFTAALSLSSCTLLTEPIQAAPRQVQTSAIGKKIVAVARNQLGTQYTQQYFSIKYPNGDPPRHLGACTDVVIRALRPVGYDLQRLIHEDMKRNFRLYPRKWRLRKPDTNIDHRRVLNQRVWMQRFATALPLSTEQSTLRTWQPGDIVYWKFENGLDHCGIISDKRGPGGLPLVIHNLGGCREEDALRAWRIVGHFRLPKC
jgi:uncharacterized protein YijF (DUF1287 family)